MTRIGNYDGLVIGTVPAAPILFATKTLTNAQIKDLPITPIEIVAAPGSGKMIQPLFGTLYAKTTSGAYSNINAAAYLGCSVPSGPGLGNVPNDASITAGSATRLSDLLGGANNRTVNLAPYFDTEAVDGWGPIGTVMATAGGTNAPLQLFIDNIGSLSLASGHANNTLTVYVSYLVVTVP